MTTPYQDAITAIDTAALATLRDLLAEYPDLLEETGEELLCQAAGNNEVEILRILLDAGVDVNGANEGQTPLGSAAHKGAVEAAACLLEHGANVNAQADPLAPTPLDEAVSHGWLELTRLLLERGADPDICCGSPARNALAAARFWRRRDIAEYLQNQGVTEITRHVTSTKAAEDAGPPTDPAQDPQEWFDEHWPPIFERGEDKGIESLSPKNQILYLVGYLIDQLGSSGTFMIYYNPPGRHAAQLADALEKIGSPQAAQVLREINAMFPDSVPAVDAEMRAQQVDDLPAEAAAKGKELEEIVADSEMMAMLHRHFCSRLSG